nr:YcxB family protein [uncultured Peptoniphilus sp.]
MAETKSLYILQIGKRNGIYIPKDAVKEEDRSVFNALLEKLKKQTEKHGD